MNGLQCYQYNCPNAEDCKNDQGNLKDCDPKEDTCYAKPNGKW